MADLISVVMGVRNGGDGLAATIDSVLAQEGVELELVVIDDGSNDGSSDRLDQLARQDPRLKVVHRPGQGLTRSLVEGCDLARGDFIARQDAGDLSLPGRLRQQLDCLNQHPEASLCSTHVRLVVAEGATARVNAPEPETLADGLTGPAIHGSVMMRSQAYRKAGGYRPAFYYAQDIDLWSRMVEFGSHLVVPEVLYEATLSPGSISGSRRQEQEHFHGLIVAATQARRRGESEQPWLEQAETFSQQCRQARRDPRKEADGAYFIGACLAASDPELARNYLRQTLALNPWHLKARLKLVQLR
jgi:glycosyltransferase involved in cell wall biosynthesis